MKIKEKIDQAVNTMTPTELMLLYEQIKVLESSKETEPIVKKRYSIEDIHKLTASSKGTWSDDVIDDRAERI